MFFRRHDSNSNYSSSPGFAHRLVGIWKSENVDASTSPTNNSYRSLVITEKRIVYLESTKSSSILEETDNQSVFPTMKGWFKVTGLIGKGKFKFA